MAHLTDELQEVILAGIRANLTFKLSAESAGINVRSFYDWMEWGERDHKEGKDTKYSRFSLAVKKTKGDKAKELLARIEAAGATDKNWTASAWLMERVHRAEYSQHGDVAEKLSQQIAALAERLDKREAKALSAQVNPEPDKESS